MKNIKYIILGGLFILIFSLYLPYISKNNINNTSSAFSAIRSWLGIEPSSDKSVISFGLVNAKETLSLSGIVNEKNKTISVKISPNTNLADLISVIDISSGATVYPNSGEVVNFFSDDGSAFKVPVYIVTAEDGSTQEYKLYVSGDGSDKIYISSKDSFVMDSISYRDPSVPFDRQACEKLEVGSIKNWRLPTKVELENIFLIGDTSSFVPEDFYYFGNFDGLLTLAPCNFLYDPYNPISCVDSRLSSKIKIRCVADVIGNSTNVEHFNTVGKDATYVNIKNGNTGDNVLEIGLSSVVGNSPVSFEITLPKKANISVPYPSVATKKEGENKNVYTISGLSVGSTQRWLITAEDGTQKYFSVKRTIKDIEPLPCESFTYSDWSECANRTQTRTITSSLPIGCAGGNPELLSQSCMFPLEWSSVFQPKSWADADAFCKNPTNGYKRLPTLEELKTALTNQFGVWPIKSSPFIDGQVYWSNTFASSVINYPNWYYTYYYAYWNNSIQTGNSAGSYNFRCVR